MKSKEFDKLVAYIAKLPGLGKRSAVRIALYLLENKDVVMLPLAENLQISAEKFVKCKKCHNFDVTDVCYICMDEKRDRSKICVIETVSDLMAMEKANIYKGLYFVLGGTLSAIDGVSPEDLNIGQLISNIIENEISEIILATNATIEGQTTAHYISKQLGDSSINVKISRLGHGIPLGGELGYMDEGTILTAMESRKDFS